MSLALVHFIHDLIDDHAVTMSEQLSWDVSTPCEYLSGCMLAGFANSFSSTRYWSSDNTAQKSLGASERPR